MQPNDQFQPQQYPSDYLNSIAAPTAVKTLNPIVLWGLIAGALVLVVVAFFAISSAGGSSTPSGSLSSVAAQMNSLQDVTKSAQGNLQSSELRTINSGLTLALTNANRDLADPLKQRGISLKDKKKNKTVAAVAAETDELKKRLEDARLNAVYDRTYAREMTFALKSLRSDMAALYKASNSKSLKETLVSADDNLLPLTEEFSSFNAS